MPEVLPFYKERFNQPGEETFGVIFRFIVKDTAIYSFKIGDYTRIKSITCSGSSSYAFELKSRNIATDNTEYTILNKTGLTAQLHEEIMRSHLDHDRSGFIYFDLTNTAGTQMVIELEVQQQ